jgi:nucleoid DNA-binding protein
MKKTEEIEKEKEIDELPPGIEEYSEQVSGNIPISFWDQKEFLYHIRAKTGLEISVIEIILKEYFQEIRNSLLRKKEAVIFGIGRLVLGKRKVNFFPAKELK